MRVLLIDQFSELGGAQRGFLEAAEGFAARGWQLHAVVPTGPLVNRLKPLCASLTTIACGPFRSVKKSVSDVLRFSTQFASQASGIARVIQRAGVDVLYVNAPRVLPAAAWARSGRPLIFHSHSVVTQRSAVRLAGHALRWSDATVVASSEFVRGWLAPLVPPARIQVIYNGIRGIGVKTNTRTDFRRIGTLGRIAPEKGQLTFVQAARIASEFNPSLTFFVAGAPVFGNQDYTQQMHDEAGPNVRFEGWTENIAEFFSRIDVLVVPSEAVDANPRVIPEAYAAGVPVISFDSGGVAELLEHNETGILVKDRSPKALAAAILSAVRDPEALNRMARNGHQRWRERYTLPRYQSELCDALERAVDVRLPRHTVRASASA
jgi:glycosyltransferase involved in cell wall biosynthesis